MSTNGAGGTYAPLRQRLSDSESDVEKHRETRPVMCDEMRVGANGDLSRVVHNDSDGDDANTTMNTAETTTDNVSFLQSDGTEKMSFPRRCAFIASLLACVITVAAFLWGPSCSVGTCSADWKDRTAGWEMPYEDIELSGGVQVVSGATPGTRNLLFLYRKDWLTRNSGVELNTNGILLIVGSSGKVGWYTRESRVPTDISCSLIDVNKDGQKDCIISGNEGLLAALNPLSGSYYWYIHQSEKVFKGLIRIDFPKRIKDLDKDGVDDLVSVATIYPSHHHNTLVIFSGATGSFVGEPLTINECVTVEVLPEFDNVNVTYLCKNGTYESVRVITNPLWMKKNKSEHNVGKLVYPFSNKIKSGQKRTLENTRQVVVNGPGKLIVENSGNCPTSCRVNLKLILEKNGTNSVNWEYSANKVAAMRPSIFKFANSINGFVIKL